MQIARSLVFGVLIVGLACSEGTAPPVPSAMVAAGGSLQSGLPGVELALPLRVTLTGAGGAPFPGARVTFTVTVGSASLGTPVVTSNASGEAATTVTIGVIPGAITVMASVTGVPSVSFSLTALNPCTVLRDISADTTVGDGVLTNFDCQFNGPYFTDFYRVTLPAQAGLTLGMTATYDTYLEQYSTTNDAFIGVNDDLDSVATNSRINIIAGAGSYRIAASTFLGNVTGTYALTVGPRAQTLAGCRGDSFLSWITRGVAFSEQIEATDCVTLGSGGVRFFGDRVFITLTPARNLSMTMASGVFNPRIELWELVNGTPPSLVSRASVTGTSGVATLNYTPAAGALFRLEFTTADSVQTGAYTLNVTGPTPADADLIMLPNAAPLLRELQRARVPSGAKRRN